MTEKSEIGDQKSETDPVPCGCGGSAKVCEYLDRYTNQNVWFVTCKKCGTHTNDFTSRDAAIATWNRAMVRKTGEWIIEADYNGDEIYQCPFCKSEFVLIDGTPEDNEYEYCPKCGAYLRYVPISGDVDDEEDEDA